MNVTDQELKDYNRYFFIDYFLYDVRDSYFKQMCMGEISETEYHRKLNEVEAKVRRRVLKDTDTSNIVNLFYRIDL